jgi:hypothetical protein
MEAAMDEADILEDDAGSSRRPDKRDRPLTGRWRLEVDFGLGKSTGRRLKQSTASRIVYGDLLVAYRVDPQRWVSYSRRKASYAALGRYRPVELTLTTVKRFIEEAVKSEIIEHQKSSPGRRGRQSRIRLLKNIAAGLEYIGAALIYSLPETVILRDSSKMLVDYVDNDETRQVRFNLSAINEALAATDLVYRGKIVRTGEVLAVDQKRIVVHKTLRRIYNNSSFLLGGRFYGPWWQNIGSVERGNIAINGRRAIERDYSQLHPRLLYAMAGKALQGDAYEIAGLERPLVKRAMNTLINADNELAAIRSIAQSIGGHGAYMKARSLIALIRHRHGDIGQSFGSGAGLVLMNIDADMAESVMLNLIERGIASLPVHDSFIVEERHAGALEEIMAEVLDLTLRRIDGNTQGLIGFSQKVPQYGDRVSLPSAHLGGGGEPDGANENIPKNLRAKKKDAA